MKVLEALEKSKNFWYLFSISIFFFLLRFPSLFEPNWYGDEGVYQAVGDAIRNGRMLYSEIWENKPPLLYILYAIFDSDQFTLRLISLIVGLLSVFVFYKLTQKLFSSNKASLFSTFVFALLFGLPVIEGNIANAENFMILPTLISALIIVNIKEKEESTGEHKRNLKLAFSAGLILGISFLFKTVAIFDFVAFLLFIALFVDKNFISHIRKRKYEEYEVKKVFHLTVGFLVFPLITSLYFLINGVFADFINATLLSNIGYVGHGNKFIIPQGLLLLKLAILSIVITYLFKRRSNLSGPQIFIWIWFLLSLFNAMFSQRPYTHYLLVLLPSFVLLMGEIFSNRSTRKTNILIVVLTIFIIFKNFWIYGKILPYYENFISFITHNKTVTSYQRFFDRLTPVDYELSAFIKGNATRDEFIFTWGNNAQLYKLTSKLPPGRYTVAYHITGAKNGIEETKKNLEEKKPKIIIIMPYMDYFPFPLSNYAKRMQIVGASVYERL